MDARRTPLPPIDREQVAEFWARYLAASGLDPATPAPDEVECFGDSVELADELIELVVHGPKRATAGAHVDYLLACDPIPEPGRVSIATDGKGHARAVLLTTEVRIGPLSSVDDRFAWDEGEGDRTLASWMAAHEGYFRRYLPTIGVEFDPDMATVFERFDVTFAE